MSRTKAILLALLALAAGVVVVLAMRNPQPPMLPADAFHASFEGHLACLTCHGPNGAVPQSRSHPLGNDCLRCHGRH